MKEKKMTLPGSVKFLCFYCGGLPLIQIPVIGLCVGLWAWFKSPAPLNKIEETQLADTDGKYKHWPQYFYKMIRILRYFYLYGSILMTIIVVGYAAFMFYLMNQL